MPRITIDISDKERSILSKRAKKGFMSLKEQVEDIVRRSAISYKNRTSGRDIKIDDKLIAAFSRSRRGRKPKKRKK